MFQNISRDFEESDVRYEDVEFNKKEQLKVLFHKILAKENIFLYIVCLLVSMVNFRLDNSISLSIFGLAMLAASMSSGIPVGIIYVICGVRNFYWIWKPRSIIIFVYK